MTYQVWRTVTIVERVLVSAVSKEQAIEIAQSYSTSLFKTESISDPVYWVENNNDEMPVKVGEEKQNGI